MSKRIDESELIINPRGAVYHLDVRPDEIAYNIITVGDPDRVPRVSKYFDKIEVKRQHREFVTHTGLINNKRISVVSTGIGTDNIDIALNELDALVNIDFETRMVKPELTKLNIMRIGTSGSLQGDIRADSFVAGTHGLGIDNLLNFYKHESNEEENQILQSFLTQTRMHDTLTMPYVTSAAPSLLKLFTDGFYQGITATCPGFYGPQGRVLRLGLAMPSFLDNLTNFSFGPHRIVNFEMETSAIYGLGGLLGHQCLSLNAIIADRIHHTFSKDPIGLVDKLIQRVLNIMADNL